MYRVIAFLPMFLIQHVDHVFEGLSVGEIISLADPVQFPKIYRLILSHSHLIQQRHDNDFHAGLLEFLDSSFLNVEGPVLL